MAIAITTGTKTALMRSASRWIGARDALGLAHQADDPRQHAVRAQRGGAEAEARRCG